MKRLLSFLLSLALLFCALPAGVSADGQTIRVGTAEELCLLSRDCVLDTRSAGITVLLTADIDLSGSDFEPIPLFGGTFDGQGHTVRGLSVTADGSSQGLFRRILPDGVVRNLRVSGCVTPGGVAENIGGIAGVCAGRIENCSFSGEVSGNKAVGGIAGSVLAGGSVSGCTTDGTLGGQHRAGGIVGDNGGLLSGSTNAMAVNTTYRVVENAELTGLPLSEEELLDIMDIGGVAGLNAGIVSGCANDGAVGYPHVGYNVGGVAGRQSGRAVSCVNRGTVCGRKDVGGIIGQMVPDAFWSAEGGSMQALRDELSGLHDSLDRLYADAAAVKSAAGADAQTLLDRMQAAQDAAGEVLSQTEDWLNANIGAVNELSERVTLSMKRLAPVSDDLGSFAGRMSEAFRQFGEIAPLLRDALDQSRPGFDALDQALGGLQSSLGAAEDAAASVRSAIEHFRAAFSGALDTQEGLDRLAEGAAELSRAMGALASALEQIDAEELPRPDGDAETLSVEVLSLWAEMGAELRGMAGELGAAAASVQKIADGAGTLTGIDPDELALCLDDLRNAFARLAEIPAGLDTMIEGLRQAHPYFDAASKSLSDALERVPALSDTLAEGTASLGKALQGVGSLLRELGELPAVRFEPVGAGQSAARQELSAALDGLNSAAGLLVSDLTDNALSDDIRAVSDRLFAAVGALAALLGGIGEVKEPSDYAEDVSDGADEEQDRGSVSLCVNRGDVDADTNAGGVVGSVSIDLSFDREDELNLSSVLAGGAKYLICATVRECSNYASVHAGKSVAGGIAGRMDYGAAVGCVSGGAVSCDGDYAGGIAGYSAGTLRDCAARVNLTAGNYAGGIAGAGHDLYGCRAIPNLTGSAEFRGSIAGTADGTVEENVYAESTVGGVDGFSYSGQCDPLAYDVLASRSDTPALFRKITVTFEVEGEVWEERDVPFGGSVGELPEVPDRDGMYWRWEEFDGGQVWYSMTVTGEYRRPVSTLSTGEETPLFFAEGTFYEGQTLQAVPFSPDLSATEWADDALLAAYTVTVRNYSDDITVRMLAQEDGRLLVWNEDGEPVQTGFRRDGRYIVFRAANGSRLAYVEGRALPWGWIAGGCALVLLAGAAALLLLRRKKKNTDGHNGCVMYKEVKEATAGEETAAARK